MPHSRTPDARGASRARTGILIVLVAQLMLVLDATVVNVALPHIATDLGFSTASLSWVLNAYTLAFGGLLLTGGRLGDVLGRLRVFQVGVAVFVVASLVGGLATSAPDEDARRRGYALFGAVSSGGASIGLLLGGLLTDLGSWRWTMFINVPIGLAVLVLAPRFVTETERVRGRFDVAGALLATSGSVTLVWALLDTPTYGWTSARTLGTAALGLVLLGLLSLVERRVAEPMLRPHLLRNRRRVGALVVMAVVVAGQMSTFFLVVQYLQRSLGFGPMASGLAFLPLSLGIFGMSRLTPRLVGRFGPAPLMVVGTAGLLTSFLILSGVHDGGSYWTTAFVALLVNGLSAGLTFMPITLIGLGDVEAKDAGAASGLLQTTQQLGAAIGVAGIVSVYAARSVPGRFVPGAREAFLTSAGFATVALLVTLTVLLPGTRTASASEPTRPVAQGGEDLVDEVLAEEAVGVGAV